MVQSVVYGTEAIYSHFIDIIKRFLKGTKRSAFCYKAFSFFFIQLNVWLLHFLNSPIVFGELTFLRSDNIQSYREATPDKNNAKK